MTLCLDFFFFRPPSVAQEIDSSDVSKQDRTHIFGVSCPLKFEIRRPLSRHARADNINTRETISHMDSLPVYIYSYENTLQVIGPAVFQLFWNYVRKHQVKKDTHWFLLSLISEVWNLLVFLMSMFIENWLQIQFVTDFKEKLDI